MKHGFQSVSASFSRYIPPGPSRFATRTKHGHEKGPETCRNPGVWWHPATNIMGISWEDCEKWTYFGKIHVLGIFRQNNINILLLGWANVETMVKTCENKHKWWQVFVVSQALDKRILDLRSTHDEDPSIQMIPCRIFWGPSLPNLSTCPPHLRSHMCQWQ